jgi:hypothetical protein
MSSSLLNLSIRPCLGGMEIFTGGSGVKIVRKIVMFCISNCGHKRLLFPNITRGLTHLQKIKITIRN